jgi:hypothetical protein
MALVIEGTRQELFDKIVKGLDAQKWRRCVDTDNSGCLYINERGDRCAVGYLLGDFAKEVADLGDVSALIRAGHLKMSKETEDFLRRVQDMHDYQDMELKLKDIFRRFARENNLKWNLPR